MDILETIVAHKRLEVARQKEVASPDLLFNFGSQRLLRPTNSMRQALARSPLGIIAEFKRRSPSKGWLSPGAKVEEAVPAYERSGAAACSILNDSRFFGGSFTDFQRARSLVSLPLLRKDFILDEYQIYQSRVLGADVVLLIAAILSKELCKKLASVAHQLDMEVLLEVHSENELSYYNDHIDMLGVNNRNLGTFHTDIKNSFRMIESIRSEIGAGDNTPLLVSESGISDMQDIYKLRHAGFRGFLIGETLMKQDPDFQKRLDGCNARLFIKVCGMRDPENIGNIEVLDVDFQGFIFYEQSPRYVPNEREYIEAIRKCKKNKVGVFVNETKENIVDKAKLFQLNYLQLHGNETPEACHALRRLGYHVIKSFLIASVSDFHQTERYHNCCDYYLFDTKSNDYGGSGKRFDWSLLDAYQGKTPFLLSGGLDIYCVDEIKRMKHPQFAGVDLNSGFEISPAMKNVGLLKEFIEALKIKSYEQN